MSAAPTDTANNNKSEPNRCALDLTEPFVLGDWHIDPSSRTASRGATVVKIDPRNMRVLQILVERHGQVVSQRELESLAWEGVVVTPDSLYQSIRQLRQALGDAKSPAKYIETVPRRGYRMVSPPAGAQAIGDPPAPDPEYPATRLRGKRFGLFMATAQVRKIAVLLILLIAAVGATPFVSRLSASRANSDSVISLPIGTGVTAQREDTSTKSFRMLLALGYDALREGRAREAVEYFERALQRQVVDAGEENQLVVEVLGEIANAYMWLDEDSAAHDAAAKALSIADRLGPASSPERIAAVVTVVDTLICLGRYEEAEHLISDAVERARSYYGASDAMVARPTVAYASVLFAQGRMPEAEQVSRDAIAIVTRARGVNEIHTAYARSLLAVVLLDQGKLGLAEQEARAVVDIANRIPTNGPHPHPYEASATHFLAEALMKQGDYVRAELLFKKEIDLLSEMEVSDWRIARSASALGETYLRRGRVAEAEHYLLMAKSKLTRTKGWPIEREVRNLASRLAQLQALQPKLSSATAH